MTLPISGPISADDINTELMVPPTSTTALNDPPVRTMFARPTINSEISYDHGHGKFTSVFLSYVPPGNPAYGLNLRQMAIDSGWNQNAYVELTIGPSTVISSTSASIPSLTIDGTFPNGAKLINNGTIIGRGGDGGRGGYGDWGAGPSGTAGGTGGVGVNVSTPVIIENNGTMGGGGGGGGGGGSGIGSAQGVGGGGGGGGGYGSGAWVGGGNGTLLGGGGGGGSQGGRGKYSSSGAGGFGGNPGAAGVGGSVGQRGQGAGGGGAPGVSVNGDRYVTWTALGTKYGSSIS